MPEEYLSLVAALKAMSRDAELLPMAEDGWNTRPDNDSYGIVSLDFEADSLYGDDLKEAEAYEGSVDLYSRSKTGDGWIPVIRATLTECCGGCWGLNYHGYEHETGLFHWEWTFQVEG